MRKVTAEETGAGVREAMAVVLPGVTPGDQQEVTVEAMAVVPAVTLGETPEANQAAAQGAIQAEALVVRTAEAQEATVVPLPVVTAQLLQAAIVRLQLAATHPILLAVIPEILPEEIHPILLAVIPEILPEEIRAAALKFAAIQRR